MLFDSHYAQTVFLLLSHPETACSSFLGSTPVSQNGNFTNVKIREAGIHSFFSTQVLKQEHALDK